MEIEISPGEQAGSDGGAAAVDGDGRAGDVAGLRRGEECDDGAGISAWMDRDPSAETAARTIAAALVDAAIPA